MEQVTIPFDERWGSIAVSVSGGADSALLAYLVCSKMSKNQTIHIINHTRMWKSRPWQQYDGRRVYEYLLDEFPELTFVLHKNFIAPELEYGNMGPNFVDEYGKKVSGDNIQQRSYAEFICSTHDIDAYFNGVTRNPRVNQFNGMQERDIEPSEENKHMEYMIHMGKVVSHPFRFVDKSWIIKKYKELGKEDLLNITRSCEGEFKEIDYTNYKPGQYVPVCNECFWCKERSWAIEQAK